MSAAHDMSSVLPVAETTKIGRRSCMQPQVARSTWQLGEVGDIVSVLMGKLTCFYFITQ